MIEKVVGFLIPGFHSDTTESWSVLQLEILAGTLFKLRIEALVAH